MKFMRDNGGVVSFDACAVETFIKYRQLKSSDSEAGGMLIGRLIIDCNDVVIDEVTIPFPWDKRSRFSFFRTKSAAQKLVEERWKTSNTTQIYLGEWHTHPEDDPTPSINIDLKNWHKITKTAVFEQESLFFVIVGCVNTRTWELNKITGKLTELRQK